MDKKESKLDELLDSALADYSSLEPRAGLEGRILANLATAEPEKKTWFRWWPALSLAVGTAAIALVIFFAWPKDTAKAPQIAAAPAPGTLYLHGVDPAESIPVAAAQPSNNAKPAPHPRSGLRKAPEPLKAQLAIVKQDVFPAPSPLSDQEKLLLAYVRRTPREEIAANAKPDDEPVLKNQINEVLPIQKIADSNTNTR